MKRKLSTPIVIAVIVVICVVVVGLFAVQSNDAGGPDNLDKLKPGATPLRMPAASGGAPRKTTGEQRNAGF